MSEEDRTAMVSMWILAMVVAVLMVLGLHFANTARFDSLEAQIEELHR